MKNKYKLLQILNENEVKEGDIPFYNSSKKQKHFANIADYPVQQAFKEAGVDMGKSVMTTDVKIHGYDEDVDNTLMNASEAASYYEEERKEYIAQALKDYGKEWDDLSKTSPGVMPEYHYASGGWDEMPDGHDFKLVIEYSEGFYVIISQKSSGVEKEISEGSKNFDLKKFLTENKLTTNSRKLIDENISEADRDEESMVHELIGDLFAPGNARSHLDLSVKEIARALKRYGDDLPPQGVKDAMDLYDKLAADGTLDKEVEDGDGFISSYHVPKLKKAFELIGLYNEK